MRGAPVFVAYHAFRGFGSYLLSTPNLVIAMDGAKPFGRLFATTIEYAPRDGGAITTVKSPARAQPNCAHLLRF